MIVTFERVYRDLGRATALALFAALGFLALALGSALGGFADAVISFRQAAGAVGYVSGGLLALFLVTSLVATLMRYLNRPATPIA